MSKIENIIKEVKNSGEWAGKLLYHQINEIHSKGLFCLAIEGGRYIVQDLDKTLNSILHQNK